MIPASILLIILIVCDLASHIALWFRETHIEERAADMVREAFERERNAIVKVSDYERDHSDIKREIQRLRAWSKMPDEFKF